jgi:protein-S-isoprenylcysteine O-methyltransferase Ste14
MVYEGQNYIRLKEATMIQKMEHGLGAEHPLWDTLQNVIILTFFTVLVIDGVSKIYLGHSTVLTNAISLPILFLPAVILIGIGVYLIRASHKAVLVRDEEPKFIETGVYSRVRHPMYLGMLLIPLGFLFLEFSLIAFVIWTVFLIVCDWMASYEERDLIKILGERYIAYRKKVPKWLPKL